VNTLQILDIVQVLTTVCLGVKQRLKLEAIATYLLVAPKRIAELF
jgi:hypothetical protein